MSVASDGQYDLEDAGFDSFLSRSVDQTPVLNLDSPQPSNFALPFDRTQVTGSQGDTFNMGGIGMNAKENTITLNDGTLHVNDTSTNSSIQASSGNITYFDSTGNLVVQEGLLPDGATGIKIVDKQQIGLAQFGRFKDGSTALKIAKPNIEVSTARDDQLIFNSSQDIFKIYQTGTISVTLSSLGANSAQTTTVAHLLGTIPAFMCFVTMPSGAPSNYSPTGLTAMPTLWINQEGSGYGALLLWASARADVSNLYIDLVNPSTGTITGPHIFSFRYYILQETAATS